MPKDIDKRSHWITVIKRTILNFSCTKHSIICSQHFEKKCFTRAGDRIKLKPNAIPTIFTELKAKYKVCEISLL